VAVRAAARGKAVKWLLVSDTHSNLEALEAVLADADFDRLAFLGDAVDYGPDPEPVVDILKEAAGPGGVLVQGNHDQGVATPEEEFDPGWWSPVATDTMRYSRSRLRKDQVGFLAALPPTAKLDFGAGGRALLCHGSPQSNREYLWPDLPEKTLKALLDDTAQAFDYLLVGHSHLQFARSLPNLTIVNPGSVGQPRDGNPQAAYAIMDTGEGALSFHRVDYAIEKTTHKIRERAMPHAERLVRILRSGGG